MPCQVIIGSLFLLLACLARGAGSRAAGLARIAIGLGSAVALGFTVRQCSFAPDSSAFILDDAVCRAVLLAATFSCLLIALLERHPVTLAATCWSAGLLVVAASGNHPLIPWAAMLFSVLALMFYGRVHQTGPLWKRHSTILLGSVFFTAGLLLLMTVSEESFWKTPGMVLLICGVGGMLHWFPFPRIAAIGNDPDPVTAVLGQRLLPALTAGVVFWRLSEFYPYSVPQGSLLVVAGLFSLAVSSARLLREDLLSRRLTLIALSTLSFLVIAVFLQNWERLHPQRAWSESSNLPTGLTLFVSILIYETLACLLLISGQRLLLPQGHEGDVTDTLAGVVRQRPIAALPFLAGLCSLSGMPPWPGFWWRLGLVATCLLPHRQSTLTHVNERDNGIALLAVVLLILMILNSLGNLRLLQRVLFEPPFRIRDHRLSWTAIGAVIMMVTAFAGAAVFPLSLEQKLVPLRTPIMETFPRQQDRPAEDHAPAPTDGTGFPRLSDWTLPTGKGNSESGRLPVFNQVFVNFNSPLC